MLKEVLKSIIQSQQEWLTANEDEITREQISKFTSLTPFGYFLTGVRRAGKSTFMKQIMRLSGSINYFNFEDSRTAGFGLNDFLTVESLFNEISGDQQWLFFDEIQNVEGWERYVRDAIDRKKTVIITGSNARLLSKELGTKLTGRHLDYEVFPFS
ncbi:MAG: AAA family ATPase, partial [Bacteroidales bacterium]|nr:AAA family ATPase [Bacteroidales bacterium]